MYFEELSTSLATKKPAKPMDWYSFGDAWNRKLTKYASLAKGDSYIAALAIARDLGIGAVELNQLWGRGVVELPETEIARAERILGAAGTNIVAIDSPCFKPSALRTSAGTVTWPFRVTTLNSSFIVRTRKHKTYGSWFTPIILNKQVYG